MSIKVTDEVTITRKRTTRIGGRHSSQNAANGGRRRSYWPKEFYGKPISKAKYFEVLENWDCLIKTDPDPGGWNTQVYVCAMCDVSPAMILAIVQDRENYRARKRRAIEAKRQSIEQ